MILDYYKNYKQYLSAVPHLEEGMNFVATLQDVPAGRYDGENGIFANVQEGDTYDITDDKMETHCKYIDVQFVCKGREYFQWEDKANVTEAVPYDEKADATFYTGEGTQILASEGMFYILFPHDAHKCRGKVAEQGEPYRKIVLKLPVD